MSDITPTPEFKNDHDLLIAMYVKQNRMGEDLKELKDNTAGRVTDLEKEKADQQDLVALQTSVTELAKSVAYLQRVLWIGMGFMAAVQVYLQFFRN